MAIEKNIIDSFLKEDRCVLVSLLDKASLGRWPGPLTSGQQVLVGVEHKQQAYKDLLSRRSSTWCTIGITWLENSTEVQAARSLSQLIGMGPNHQLVLFQRQLASHPVSKAVGLPQDLIHWISHEDRDTMTRKDKTMTTKVYRQCPSIGRPRYAGLKLVSICSSKKLCKLSSIQNCPSPLKNQVQIRYWNSFVKQIPSQIQIIFTL